MENLGRADAAPPLLNGARIMIVEDDFIIAMELETLLRDAGAEIAGICRNVKEALALANPDGLSVAVLDVRLDGEMVTPVARRLARWGIPFVFYTGQVDTAPLRAEWPDCPIIAKPVRRQALVRAVAAQLRG